MPLQPFEAAIVPASWSSLCADSSTVMRIAAVGDSLTAGDNFHLPMFNPNTTGRCKMSDGNCRGNWPISLQELLGHERYLVRNFGLTGHAACGSLPQECFEPPSPPPPPPPPPPPGVKPQQSEPPLRLPLSLNGDSDALANCSTALRHAKHSLVSKATQFDPHAVIMMLGTNDAAGFSWDRCGAEGFRRSMLLLLKELWQNPTSSGKPPIVFLLSPPPVLSEFSGHACVAMQSCRYAKCQQIGECTACAPGGQNTCIRVPELQRVRKVVDTLGAELRHAYTTSQQQSKMTGSGGGGGGGGGGGCGGSPIQLMLAYHMVPPSTAMFTGPIHLQAKASALIACALHEKLSWCGTDVCVGPDGNATAAAEGAKARHAAFCEPLRRGMMATLAADANGWRPQHGPDGEHYGAHYWDTIQRTIHSERG